MSKTLIFVSSHRSANRVADRMIGAVAAGCRVELLAFEREVVDHPVYHDAKVRFTSLGNIRGGVAYSRLYSLARAAWTLALAGRRLKKPDTIVLVNSLELLILCALCGLTRMPTVYDVSDIHPLQLAKTTPGRLMRWLERLALRRVELLAVTSPWFYWEYYRRWLGVRKAALLIENKVRPGCLEVRSAPVFTHRIAWNGLLRCRASAALLFDSLKQAPASLQVSLHGTLDRLGEVGQQLTRLPNCEYTGPYDPDALSTLIAKSSFVWAIDFSECENSTWLLPYRLYNAIAAGVPVIAASDTATAQVVRRHDIGLVLNECTSGSLIQALERCDAITYERWRQNTLALGERAVRHDEWARVFENAGRWEALRRLPNNVDVDIVLSANDPITAPAEITRSAAIEALNATNADSTESLTSDRACAI
jgi:hypothetical protein